jgi:uncharacterized protein (DUF302 family)
MKNSIDDSISLESGLIERESKNSVAETLDKLEMLVESKGMKVFARINHAEEARLVGLEMRPTEVLIFGDPKTGTPLMNRYPFLAIDLPFKTLCWEDENGQIRIAYTSPLYLQNRYSLEETPFQEVARLIEIVTG